MKHRATEDPAEELAQRWVIAQRERGMDLTPERRSFDAILFDQPS